MRRIWMNLDDVSLPHRALQRGGRTVHRRCAGLGMRHAECLNRVFQARRACALVRERVAAQLALEECGLRLVEE
jgi:hypothetical protein